MLDHALGMWSSSFYLGNFLGATLAGILIEAWGFRYATVPYWIGLYITLIMNVLELAYNMKQAKDIEEYKQLD